MSHTSIHDNDHGGHYQESSTTSLMGIDAVASADETHERAVLLDVERDSTQYGSTTQLTNGGIDSILYWFLPVNHSFIERKHLISKSTVAKRVKYYIPSLAWIPNYSFSLYVSVILDAPVQISSPSIVLEVTL